MRKMRKILLIILAPVLLLSLLACTDAKLSDDTVNVIFYTGSNASYVDTYFDISVGDLIEAPEEPTKPNFDFLGWYKDVNYQEVWDFESDIVTKSIVLFARWGSRNWPVEFILNTLLGEEYVDSSVVPNEINSSVNTYLPVVKRPGGSFKGWILVPPEEYTLDMKIYRYSNDLPKDGRTEFTLYPIFTNNKYLVSYNPRMEGVSVPPPKSGVEYGVIINFLPQLADTATHKFVGWYTKNGTNSGDWGVEIKNGDYYAYASNLLLNGRWEPK